MDERELARRSDERIVELGATLGTQVSELTTAMHRFLSGEIRPLQGDRLLLDLLYASVESNVETLVHIMRHGIPVEGVVTPVAAAEYARRVAQRGISSSALIRAYRLGQQLVLNWAFDEIRRREADQEVAFAAARGFTDLTFRYVDSISEQVLIAYETEREAWLSHRNTMRTAVIEELVAGPPASVASAEQSLGYRLRQHHLAVVLWIDQQDEGSVVQHEGERYLGALAETVGSAGAPVFIARDQNLAWGWIPLGHTRLVPGLSALAERVPPPQGELRAAVGTPSPGADGFRISHDEAVLAHRVAAYAGPTGARVTTYADSGVRTAAMLAADLAGTRRMVGRALGALAERTEPAERLRETLEVFLAESGSYVATAERVHLHKNTIKYRIDRAIEERGRPLDEERLELEIALIACRWLGESVLVAGP